MNTSNEKEPVEISRWDWNYLWEQIFALRKRIQELEHSRTALPTPPSPEKGGESVDDKEAYFKWKASTFDTVVHTDHVIWKAALAHRDAQNREDLKWLPAQGCQFFGQDQATQRMRVRSGMTALPEA